MFDLKVDRKKLNSVDKVINKVIHLLNEGLDQFNYNKETQANNYTQLLVKSQKLRELYYQFRRELRFKETLLPTLYKEYPYKTFQNGYIYLYSKDLLKFKAEHRYIIEQKIGRKLETKEIVHHKDKNPFNNIINNLEILSAKGHKDKHKHKK